VTGIPEKLIKEKQDEKERKIIEIEEAKKKLMKIKEFALSV
jgi:hypothetical protein